MARNRNSLIQENCIDDRIDDPREPEEREYIPSFRGREPEVIKDELYVYQDLIGIDVKDVIREVTEHLWFYSGQEDEIEEQKLLLSNPVSTLIYNNTNGERVTAVSDAPSVGRKGINKISESTQEGEEYLDVVISQWRPEVINVNTEVSRFSVSTHNKYNFYNELYETKFSVPTTGLPNYYVLSENNFYKSENREYVNQDIVSYSGSLPTTTFNNEYIRHFSEKSFDENIMSDISSKMKSIVFDSRFMTKYDEYNSHEYKEEIFPFYLKLEFDKEKPGSIFKSLKDDEAIDYLMSYVATRENQQDFDSLQFTIKNDNNPLRKKEDISLMEINYNWLLSLERFEIKRENICFLGEANKENINNITLENFIIEQSKLLDNNVRNYKDMLDGKPCYSEALFYKVDKYEIDGEDFQKVQSFYVANVDEISKFKMIDTQVKYGKKYRYEIFSYKYVLGNRYSYENGTLEQEQKILLQSYDVVNRATPFIVKMLYATIEEVLLDKPAPPPEVEVIPYKDNPEQISFFFNPSSVQYKLQDISLSEEEKRQYSLIRDSQNLAEDQLITFGGDDKVEKYYIYRTDRHPTSYQDFKDNLYAIAQTEEGCVSAEYLDSLTPNKKYYYIFRTVDVHDHISPPTAVREIELVSEDGTTFLQSKVVDFKDNQFKKQEKDVRKYIHIKPSLIQSLIDEETLEMGEDEDIDDVLRKVTLGNSNLEESVWGKFFKMRIKSKSTNKFVDVKFRFITKKE